MKTTGTRPFGRKASLAALSMLCASVACAQASGNARVDDIVQGRCFVCHGMNGESSTPAFPRLAGQHAVYTARQLADFKSGRRASDTMKPMVEDLSDDDFRLLGEFFAAQPTVAHKVDEPALVDAGRAIFTKGKDGGAPCADCHGQDGRGSEGTPRLAGQHAQYLVSQLVGFRKRERPSAAVMGKAASKLDEKDIMAVAAYLSGLK
jgi:cytochrome c553